MKSNKGLRWPCNNSKCMQSLSSVRLSQSHRSISPRCLTREEQSMWHKMVWLRPVHSRVFLFYWFNMKWNNKECFEFNPCPLKNASSHKIVTARTVAYMQIAVNSTCFIWQKFWARAFAHRTCVQITTQISPVLGAVREQRTTFMSKGAD